MKRKNFISLTVAIAFLLLASTGILLFIKQKAHFIEMTHTIFGLLFISFAIFHILNNWSSIRAYSKDRTSGSIKKELVIASLIGGIMLVLSVTGVLEPVAEFGRVFAAQKDRPQQGLSFQEKTTLDSTNGKPVLVFLQKKPAEMLSALTVEVADTTGKVLETLYSPDKEMKGPPSNLMLQTKISTPVPFKLLVSASREGKTTQQESLVRSLEPGIQSLSPNEQSPLQRAFLDIK